MARKFFYVCAGLLCLAVAFHFGTTTAQGQAGSSLTGFDITSDGTGQYFWTLTPNGDVFVVHRGNDGVLGSPTFIGNYWAGGGPTPAHQGSWGQVKARYR